MRFTPHQAALVVAATAVFGARAAAASPSAKLVYVRDAGASTCPDESELRKAVTVRIGYDPFFPVAQKTVLAQIHRVSKGYGGTVQIVGDDGKVRGARELTTTGDDCGELVTALALAVSIALDDLDEGPPATPVETPMAAEELVTPVPSPPARPSEPEPVPQAPSKEGTSKVNVVMSMGPTGSLGTGPDVAAGASLSAALRWPSVAARLDVRGELPASKAMVNAAGGGQVATNLVVATASGCVRGRVPFACIGGGAGVLFSRTDGITRPARDSAALLVGVVQAGIDLALVGSRLYLEPFVDVGANLLVPKVEVDAQVVHETSPVWGVVGLHLGSTIF